jgi:hypothetical protein
MLALKKVDFVEQCAGRFSQTKLIPPEKWIPTLINLMEGYQKNGAIRSLEALLVTLCEGDAYAALMLRHVMEWQPRSIREDGAIWRTAEEWTQYTGLTRSMVYNKKRRDILKNAGVKVWLERAWGENTLHFLIDAAKMTANIGRLLGMNLDIAKIKLWQVEPIAVSQDKAVIPFPQTGVSHDKARVLNGEIPLTENLTELLTEQTTIDLLNSVSLSVDEKAKYGVLPAAVVQGIFDAASKKKNTGQLKKPFLAYVRASLKAALKEHEKQSSPAAPASAAQSDSTPPPSPLSPSPDAAIVEGEKVVAADCAPEWWGMAHRLLERQLKKSRDWWYLARLNFGQETRDGVTLICESSIALTMCQRYQRNIERAISDVRFQTTKVRFESGGQANG